MTPKTLLLDQPPHAKCNFFLNTRCHAKSALYNCSRCSVKYCSVKCFRSHSNNKCYDLFCQENVKQHLKAKKVTSLEDKQRAAKILAKNKQQMERERPPSDQFVSERFKFFHSDFTSQKGDLGSHKKQSAETENTFGLLPDRRKEELRNLYYEGRLGLNQLTPAEQKLFLGFANRQSQMSLWVPIWAFDHFVPDLDIVGTIFEAPRTRLLIAELTETQQSEESKSHESDSTRIDSTSEFDQQLESYAAMFGAFSDEPGVAEWLLRRDQTKSARYAKISQMLQTKREQTGRSFREIKGISANQTEFRNRQSGPEDFKLYFNVALVAKSTILALILINGDLKRLPVEFLETVSCACFGLLRQGSSLRLSSFEDVYLNFIDALSRLQTRGGQSPENTRQLAEYALREFGHVISSKFLLCEVLFILYETLLDDVNDISQTVKSEKEARYARCFLI